jgi:hypothetical protein
VPGSPAAVHGCLSTTAYLEKQALHQSLLIQTQLLEHLQHEEVQGKIALEMARQELKETQEPL